MSKYIQTQQKNIYIVASVFHTLAIYANISAAQVHVCGNIPVHSYYMKNYYPFISRAADTGDASRSKVSD
jgi:hypothetical protein